MPPFRDADSPDEQPNKPAFRTRAPPANAARRPALTAPRQPLDARASGLMLLLCITWGLQQVAVKAVAADMAPTWQIALRSALAALCVLAWMAWRDGRVALPRTRWAAGAAVGTLFAAEFACIAWGLMHTTASRMSVFLYTAPLFTALALHLTVPAERLRPAQWVGVGLAFGGAVLAFIDGLLAVRSTSVGSAAAPTLWGDLLGLTAALLWTATTLTIRRSALAQAPAAQTLLFQLLGASVLLAAFALLRGDHFLSPQPAPLLWVSLGFQALVVAFASYLAWFWMLTRYLAARLSAFTFLTPIFGVAFGAVLLDEPLSPSFVAAAALVLAGLVLVNRRGAPEPA